MNAMAEEPTLPNLPSGLVNTSASYSRPFKRSRLHSSPAASSDPPVFSSDDDPSADNYVARSRTKKKFRGPWYSQQLDDYEGGHGSAGTKRTFERHFDSAVFMGSDGTDADSDADFSAGAFDQPLVAAFSPQKIAMRPAVKLAQPSAEYMLQKEIESILENGKEDVDLSGRGIVSLSSEIIRPLSTLVVIPKASQGSDFEFTRLRPALKLYLSRNQLREAPGEIFKLRGLSVLSLRSNQLREIPSAIGSLQKLVELNVSNNRLNYLPYEFLNLLSGTARLEKISLHPNQFYEPFFNTPSSSPSSPSRPNIGLYRPVSTSKPPVATIQPLHRQWLSGWSVIYQCRSEVRYLDTDGTLLQGPALLHDRHPLGARRSSSSSSPARLADLSVPIAAIDDCPSPPRGNPGSRTSKAPSLLEICVRSWSQSPNLPNLVDWLSGEDPGHLTRLLDYATLLKEREAGSRKCTICERAFVIPRTEWIEWWEITRDTGRPGETGNGVSAASPLRFSENRRDTVERSIPLMRRGCSWKCGPPQVS